MVDKILVVCLGNICRSPIGEALLRLKLPGYVIESAGIMALAGHPVDSKAKAVALENGIDLSNHFAQQLTTELCKRFDLILVMESGHIEEVSRISSSARGKTMLFGQWLEGNKEIKDPYGKNIETFRCIYRQLEQASDLWKSKLNGRE